MLKAINISKTYYTKGGASQKALDNVSLNLDSKGLVFILGKSGSGKSTLLNILGGLDVMDEGSIEIKGKNSKDFTQSDFDSYRNTYLGFIFQDFNILKEFSVKENINLAYELQHKKADEEKLDDILNQVEMIDYKDRNPNELSGGQIQRVAIARALIKNPEIIMADEPTGSLDSETGKQVFETLKNLAKTKLVVVVSHDRESAEDYADRIIELKDGKIISDETKKVTVEKLDKDTNVKIVGSKIVVKRNSKLSEKDLNIINEGLENKNAEMLLSSKGVKNFSKLETYEFIKTPKQTKQTKFKPFTLIKSKLPNKNAFKMGYSGLKHKKVKLFFTLFLTIIALTMFGLSNVLANFSVANASVSSFPTSGYTLIPIEKGEIDEDWGSYNSVALKQSYIDDFEQATGQQTYVSYKKEASLYEHMVANSGFGGGSYYTYSIKGYIELEDSSVFENNFEGSFPENYNQIVINNYLLDHFIKNGFVHYNTLTQERVEQENVTSFEDIQGKYIYIYDTPLQIVGMAKYDLSRYADIKEATNYYGSMYEDVNNFLSMLIVKDGFNNNMKAQLEEFSLSGEYGRGTRADIDARRGVVYEPDFIKNINLDYTIYGQQTTLTSNQIIIPANWYIESDMDEVTYERSFDTSKLDEYLGTEIKIDLTYTANWSSDEEILLSKNFEIVGFITSDGYNTETNKAMLSDQSFAEFLSYDNDLNCFYTLLGNTEQNKKIFNFIEDNTYRHITTFSSEIYMISTIFNGFRVVFFYMSIALCLFVSILILNFISTSITYKKHEIGILRALGARKTDVFKVFYAEGLIMGVIDYVIAMILIALGVLGFNILMQAQLKTSITLVSLGFSQFALVALVCFGVIFISSLIPVLKIAKKKPIDAIRGR